MGFAIALPIPQIISWRFSADSDLVLYWLLVAGWMCSSRFLGQTNQLKEDKQQRTVLRTTNHASTNRASTNN